MDNKSTLKNISANYGSKLWGFISIYLFIPLYIKYLGVEAYAVISFYSVILGIISFADAGLSSAITREFAKVNSPSHKFSIIKIIEKIYISICICVALILFLLAPVIAQKWLHAESLPISELIYYVRWIGLGVVLQLLSSLYFGALMGLQDQVKANIIQVIWGIIRTLGAVLIFILYKPSLEVFFIWQVICNILFVLVLRYSVLQKLKSFGDVLMQIISKLPADIKSYIGGMTVIAIISAINIQADKIATSSLFTLEQFGYYSLASSLAQVPVLLGSPLATTIFPIFSRLVSEKNYKSLYQCFQNFSFILNVIVIPVGLILSVYTKDIIVLWMGKSAIKEELIPQIIFITRLLVIGGMFLALQILPFYYLLAQGQTKYTVRQGVIQVVFGLPALYFFIKSLGLIGAGIPWIAINFGSFIFLYYILFTRFLKIPLFKFLKSSLFIPIIISSLTTLLYYILFSHLPIKYVLISPMLIGITSVVLNVLVYNYNEGNKYYDLKNLIRY